MKNPFIQMAIIAAAMTAAFRENAMRDAGQFGKGRGGNGHPGSKPGNSGKRNPAGSKIARKFIEHNGGKWKGETVHTGALTKLNNARAYKRLPMSMRVA